MFRLLTLLFCFCFLHSQSFLAQNPAISLCCDVISAAGSSASIQQTHYSWTVGETVIFTLKSPTVWLSQGFHQSDLCKPLTVSLPDLFSNLEVKIYPNPTFDRLNIQLLGDGLPPLRFHVFNLLGKMMLETQAVESGQIVPLDVALFPSGHYFLQVECLSGQTLGAYRFSKVE